MCVYSPSKSLRSASTFVIDVGGDDNFRDGTAVGNPTNIFKVDGGGLVQGDDPLRSSIGLIVVTSPEEVDVLMPTRYNRTLHHNRCMVLAGPRSCMTNRLGKVVAA